MRPDVGVLEPAPPEVDSGGGGGGWSWLVTAHDFFEAELIRGVLEGAGLPVALDLRDPSPFAWMHLAGNPQAPIRVLVPTGLLDAARLELLEANLTDSRGSDPRRMAADGTGRRSGRIRFAVAVLTLVVVAWIMILEVFGSAPCTLRLFCT